MVIVRVRNDFRACGKMDTECPSAVTHRLRRCRGLYLRSILVVALAVGAALAALPPTALAAPPRPKPLDARVIWHRADHVYVVLGDSATVAPGDTLLIHAGKKQVAAAPIVSIAEGGLAVARIVSGTLARERKLDRLRIMAARVPLPSLSVLRVGFPSARRAALVFNCGPWTLRPPLAMPYRVESMGRLGYRLTRDSTTYLSETSASAVDATAPAASWPDTIVASLFDDAADEEIALERGDLDVALFGPGELSARLREAPRWQNHLFADRNALAEASVDSSAVPAEAAHPSDRADCPVLTVPELAPYVRALGPSAFLGMLDCGTGGGRP